MIDKLTIEQLMALYQYCPKHRAALFVQPLNQLLPRYGVNTLPRLQMFLAQVGHESGELRYTTEIASGESYEGRKDLGNFQVGDGKKYKGRGLIQVTGRSNYALASVALDLPLLENPELLAEPEYSVQSALWFWQNTKLSELADQNDLAAFRKISYRINGGREPRDPNGWADRLRLWKRAQEVIK
jgi:putative chitinase